MNTTLENACKISEGVISLLVDLENGTYSGGAETRILNCLSSRFGGSTKEDVLYHAHDHLEACSDCMDVYEGLHRQHENHYR